MGQEWEIAVPQEQRIPFGKPYLFYIRDSFPV